MRHITDQLDNAAIKQGNKLFLDQHESNILYWSKHWYGGDQRENFWAELKTFFDKYYLYDCEIGDIYSGVRRIWKKIIEVMPNRDYLFDDYENETLPHRVRLYWGSPNFGNTNWHCDDSFNAEQMIRARVAKMISQIGSTAVKYYEAMMPEDVGDLKVKNKEKLQEMMNNHQFKTLDSSN